MTGTVIPPKTAVIGAHGLIGRVLLEGYRRFHPDVIGTDWQGRNNLTRLDLADPSTYKLELARSGHQWAVICAAVRDYQTCEQKKSETRERNVIGTLALARRLQTQGLKVVVFSSDVVFDGAHAPYSDEAPQEPVNEYGRQKKELEAGLKADPRGHSLILRIGRVIGVRKGDGTLADQMAQSLLNGQTVRAAVDQIFTPILVDDLPDVLAALQSQNAQGAFNVAGAEAGSRLSIAHYMAKGLAVDPRLVQEVKLEDVEPRLPRPKNITLRCDRLRQTLPFELTPLTPCLDRVLMNYRTSVSPRTFS